MIISGLCCSDRVAIERLSLASESIFIYISYFFCQEYINCAEIWVEYPCKHFTVRAQFPNFLTTNKIFGSNANLVVTVVETRDQHNVG